MPFADIDWNTFFTALAGGAVLVIGALGAWYLKILDRRNDNEKTRLNAEAEERDKEAERKAKESKQSRRDDRDDYKYVIEALRQDREADRHLIHDLRNDVNTLKLQNVLCQQGQAILIKVLEEHGIHVPSLPEESMIVLPHGPSPAEAAE